MRSPERIDKFCNELAELWKKVPDWRFRSINDEYVRYLSKRSIFLWRRWNDASI